MQSMRFLHKKEQFRDVLGSIYDIDIFRNRTSGWFPILPPDKSGERPEALKIGNHQNNSNKNLIESELFSTPAFADWS
jgi:hypothetical protein